MPYLFEVEMDAEWSCDKGNWSEIDNITVAADNVEEAVEKAKKHNYAQTIVEDEDGNGKKLKKPIVHKVLDLQVTQVTRIKQIDVS